MKKFLSILFIIHYSLFISAQEIPPVTEQQLENLADIEASETEDDSYLLQLEHFRKHPLNLNTADAAELKELRILSDWQIANLISYRKLFGNLISIYELQAVPSWDIVTIRKLLPFITVVINVSFKEDIRHRIEEGDYSLLLRISQVVEKSKGFDKSLTGVKYRGSPQRFFFRYNYRYKNLLQLGVTGDKDAGEPFFKEAQNKGFDFYSFHVFARKIGAIQAIGLGDFTINMGQGLVQWQSLAFKKSTDVITIKRQSPVLRPYSSAGEYNFHRGIGATIKKRSLEATVFVSFRKLSANLITDTVEQKNFISSFLTSGYNRTDNEIESKSNVQQSTFGTTIIYRGEQGHVGVNGIYYQFSLPLNKPGDPYNLYAISGSNGYNLSLDYSYTYQNFHFFGETATDKNKNMATVNGLLMSVDPRVDISLLYRSISKAYQAINANAFTENTYPANEKGFYAGITIRPASAWRIDMYTDIYQFPWLKYLADAPGYGKDFMLQVTYTPSRSTEIYMRYRNEVKQANQPDNTTTTNYLIPLPRQNWRMQWNHQLDKSMTIRNRIEMMWYNKKGKNSEDGFLCFFDVIYKPMLRSYSGALRVQYFETGGYNSRLYAYENDLLYGYSVPVFFDKGFRYYMVLQYEVTQKISFGLRWSQTIYRDKDIIGSGLDEIQGNKKSEIKCQGLYFF